MREDRAKREKEKIGGGGGGENLGPPINDQIMGSLDTHPHMGCCRVI